MAQRRLLSIECKNINFARNPREIANELKRFLGDKEPVNSWVGRHHKRHKWLKNNYQVVDTLFSLKGKPLHVESFLLTSEEIPSAYIRSIVLPVVSFSRLQREGIQVLAGIYGPG
jgi:hypothetical protein